MKAAPLVLAALFATSSALAGGREAPATPAPVGGQTDAHGCLSGAGQTWSALRGECVQVFNVADIRLADPYRPTQAVYVLLSADKERAELFGLGYKGGVMLHKTPIGYASVHGKVRLDEHGTGWTVKVTK